MSNIIAGLVGIVTLHQVNCPKKKEKKKEPFQQNLNNYETQKCKVQTGKLLWPKEIVINKIYTSKKIVEAKLL